MSTQSSLHTATMPDTMSKFIKTQNVSSILRQRNYTRHCEVSLLRKEKKLRLCQAVFQICPFSALFPRLCMSSDISSMSLLSFIPKAVYVKRYFKYVLSQRYSQGCVVDVKRYFKYVLSQRYSQGCVVDVKRYFKYVLSQRYSQGCVVDVKRYFK